MYCPKCGQQNPEEAKFCGKCGAAISVAATAQPVHAAPGAASETSVMNPTMKNGMIAVSVIVPIVGIVAGVVFLLDANPEKKAAGKQWLIIGLIAAVVWMALLGGG
jgi:uncharacterized membrane protein YvbJ